LYKAIIFDLDNTLLDYTRSELESMRRTCRDHSLFQADGGLEWDSFWPRFLEHNFRHWNSFVNGGEVKSIRDVLQYSFRDTLNRSELFHKQLAESYWRYFCDNCYFEEGGRDVLEWAQRQRFQLGIITNGIGEAQRSRLKAGGIDRLFQALIVSDEVGVRKPSKEIFEMALGHLGVLREEVLFVGDSLTDDYEGAVRAGIDFCYYNRTGAVLPDRVAPKYAVRRLAELALLDFAPHS